MADVTWTGTYFVVPYTTGCKFAIAALDDGDKADALFQGGRLTAPAEVALREIHHRFDVDLDGFLNFSEFAVLIDEITGKHLVRAGSLACVVLTACRLRRSSRRSCILSTIDTARYRPTGLWSTSRSWGKPPPV
jgi:hypothetical protein